MTTREPAAPASLYRFRFGTAEFDEVRFELRIAGEAVAVQRKPLEILAYLLAHPGEVVTRDELLDVVWEGRPTVDNVVANAMAKLRSALGAENAARIVTQSRVGYRFDGPLERMAVGVTLTSTLELVPGASVPQRPHFHLEAMIGRAGQSEVWLARHLKTRERRVYKFSGDGSRLASLKREATLSRLLQNNLGERRDLTRVLDWNFETPPFFLECEYGGDDLLKWSDQPDRLTALSLQQRLELFLQIADAVAAAHSVGVLHKDLKPANVLIAPDDPGWQVRLTDFGSSKLLDPQRLAAYGITGLGLTMTSSVLGDSTSGTPLYLAPELLGGAPPTAASDVYALGVMLYQLVICDLRRPMVPGWERSIDDPLLCEDIARATDGDTALRLQNVTELTTRLRTLPARHCEREVQQQTERLAHDAQQALQRSHARRPWIVAAMLALTTGLVASVWLYRDARDARAHTDAINNFLSSDVLANTGALKTDSDPDPSMRRVLRNAAAIVGDRFSEDPDSEGWIRVGIGNGLSGLGDYAAAEDQQRQAVALLKRAHGSNHQRTQVASYALAMTLLEQSKFIDAEAVLGEIDGLTDPRLRNSETAFKSFAMRGMLRAARKNCPQALTDLQAAEEIDLPASEETTYNRFNVRSWIGETLNCLGRYTEAARIYADLLLGQTDAAVGPALEGYARLGYAKALLQIDDVDYAQRQMQRALSTLESGVGEADAFTMGQALVEAGSFYLAMGNIEQARDYLQRGRTMLLEVGENQEKALNALGLLGVIDHLDGQQLAAIDKLWTARAGLQTVFGAGSADSQGTAYWLAVVLRELGRSEEAARLAAPLQPEKLQASLGGSGWSARLNALRARLMIDRGEREEGEALLAVSMSQLQDDHPLDAFTDASLPEPSSGTDVLSQ
jgi:non-specific serine/threonine protein kinase